MIERATSVALSFGIHFGNMDSITQNYTDQELMNRLQELMEVPHPQKDVSLFDPKEIISNKTIRTPYMNDIRKIELSLSTSDSADYTDGCIIEQISENNLYESVNKEDLKKVFNSDELLVV